MQLQLGKRRTAQLGDIGPAALSVGVAVIIVSVVAMILANMNSNITDANATYVLTQGLSAVGLFSDWFSIIVIVVVSVIIIALVMGLRTISSGGRA
jgi:hypothetical protein